MTDLNTLVIEAVAATVTPELIRDKVQKHVDDIIKDALKESLSSYSETGKMIKAAIGKALRVQDIDLPDYGFMVTQMVGALVKEHAAELIQGTLATDMAELLSIAPKTIKLSQIAKDMMDEIDDDSSGITVHLESPGSSSASSRWLSLDPTPDKNPHSCDVRLLVGNDGVILAGWLGEKKDLKTTKSFGNFYGLEQKIRAYYACGTVIEFDEGYVITEKYYD